MPATWRQSIVDGEGGYYRRVCAQGSCCDALRADKIKGFKRIDRLFSPLPCNAVSPVLSAQVQFPLRFDELIDSKLDLFAGVCGGYLRPDARFTLRHDRVREGHDIHALAEQKLRYLCGDHRIAE